MIVPVTIREANAFVAAWHRHHKPTQGAKFAVGYSEGADIRGVALVGRPVARLLDDGWTLEVLRVCTDGAANACSSLYGACWRITREMGYRKLITYTMPTESGTSLRAAGWTCLGERGGGTWNRANRPRLNLAPNQIKIGWQVQG